MYILSYLTTYNNERTLRCQVKGEVENTSLLQLVCLL